MLPKSPRDGERLAYLALGSNLGERHRTLEVARLELERRLGPVVAASALYQTAPVGGPPQPDFLNAAVGVMTNLSPQQIVEACLGIEGDLGRERRERNGPRSIDLDLLLLGQTVCREAGVEVPHPRMHARRFVLVPLNEIAPEARHPLLGKTVANLLAECRSPERVERYELATAR